MQVTETLSDGLKREYQVTVPASDLEARVIERLGDLKDRVRISGFRPGKVPVSHLKKVYGRAVMAETIEAIIREMNAKIVSDHGLKLAMEPKVTIPNEETEVEKVIGGNPTWPIRWRSKSCRRSSSPISRASSSNCRLPRTEAEVGNALGKIAEQNRPFAAKGGRRSRRAIAS